MNNTILLGLNEINFDFVKFYADKSLLPNFKKLLENNNLYSTASEKEYKLLEPWIQWVTVYTGKEFAEHQIYRLGDIVGSVHLEQIFEKLEDKDFSVMAVSPFNVENRLKKSKLFIPDPWTKTKVNGNWIVKAIYNAVHQTVNQNASGNFKFSSLLSLLIAFILTVPFKRFLHYMNLILKFKKPGIKAVILDSLLADIFIKYQKKINPNFSNLFLNSGAHIQHHYLFNSSAYKGKFKNPDWYCPKNYDPLLIILKEYDRIIGELNNKNNKLIIATGLHQQPHDKLTFYWRLNNHSNFLNILGINYFQEVLPRMSRDFLINFSSKKDSLKAEFLLEKIKMKKSGTRVFSIDNRGKSLFVELIFPENIEINDVIISDDNSIPEILIKKYVSFVAIKNGEHNGTGYLLTNYETKIKDEKIKLKNVNSLIYDTVVGA